MSLPEGFLKRRYDVLSKIRLINHEGRPIGSNDLSTRPSRGDASTDNMGHQRRSRLYNLIWLDRWIQCRKVRHNNLLLQEWLGLIPTQHQATRFQRSMNPILLV